MTQRSLCIWRRSNPVRERYTVSVPARCSDFDEFKGWLRKRFPIGNTKAHIYFVPDAALRDEHGCFCHGDCVLGDDNTWARIRLNRRQTVREAVETLHHEWVHILRGLSPVAEADDSEGHDHLFWSVYGEVYRKRYG